MNDGPKIVDLPTKPNEFRAAVDQMRRDEDAYLEMAGFYARVRRAYFLAYKEAGFTDAEALELAKKAPL